MTRIDEIAPDTFRISIYVPKFDLQFNHFLVRDDEPLLFHTGMRGMFPLMREAVATLIDPAALRFGVLQFFLECLRCLFAQRRFADSGIQIAIELPDFAL